MKSKLFTLALVAFIANCGGEGSEAMTEKCFSSTVPFSVEMVGEVGSPISRASDENHQVCFGTSLGDMEFGPGTYSATATPSDENLLSVTFDAVYVRLNEVTPPVNVEFPADVGDELEDIGEEIEDIGEDIEDLEETIENLPDSVCELEPYINSANVYTTGLTQGTADVDAGAEDVNASNADDIRASVSGLKTLMDLGGNAYNSLQECIAEATEVSDLLEGPAEEAATALFNALSAAQVAVDNAEADLDTYEQGLNDLPQGAYMVNPGNSVVSSDWSGPLVVTAYIPTGAWVVLSPIYYEVEIDGDSVEYSGNSLSAVGTGTSTVTVHWRGTEMSFDITVQ